MNYLAHVYLSGNDIELAMGNFIADSVKGNKYNEYPMRWQKGILLHRFIDSYTDSHLIFKSHAKLFFNSHRHYSRVLIDMYYDHILAKNWSNYHEKSLKDFSNQFYKKLLENEDHLPLKVKSSLKYLISDNWFNLYSTIDGLKRILAQMESRIKYTSKLSESTDKFVSLLYIIEPEFFLFFEDIQKATKTELLKTKYK
tara:strand:+ start:1248 stop:1841 length:594 start_codon:yes stop_codon:yes gene_type:complete